MKMNIDWVEYECANDCKMLSGVFFGHNTHVNIIVSTNMNMNTYEHEFGKI